MWKTEWLTDDETALGALNFLSQKGRTVNKRLLSMQSSRTGSIWLSSWKMKKAEETGISSLQKATCNMTEPK